jgi:tetratricopeptide (TPR) repeat protein
VPHTPETTTDWIEALSQTEDRRVRQQALLRHTQGDSSELAGQLYQAVVRLARVDLVRAEHVAEALGWLAEKSGQPQIRALKCRAAGHVFYLTGNYKRALEEHAKALAIFEELGPELDAARAMMNHLQPMIYLGEYDAALTMAERARAIFRKHNDQLRLARLDTNVGNVRYRQDRFAEALELYERSYRVLIERGDEQDVAIVLRNMAVCFISLNRFEDALATYRNAREHCESHNLPLLVAECDYNIAYLHYLRGEYTRAIGLYQTTRSLCEKLSDRYHTALCDLDLSELYLELNLSEEGFELAGRAQKGFEQLSMGYEAAKAVTFQAIAASQERDVPVALREFARARALFERERNALWPALIDLYQALVLEEAGEYARARELSESALRYFRESPAVTKAALCDLLLARLDLQEGRHADALAHCQTALDLLKQAEAPAADFQAQVVLGQIEEARGDPKAAYAAYDRAQLLLEGLRSRLLAEELKISFLKDKLSVYESLVSLAMADEAHLSTTGDPAAAKAFDFMERAKSRSLADLISFSLHDVRPKAQAGGGLATRVEELRLQLTMAYRQVQQEEMLSGYASPSRVQSLRRNARELQSDLRDAASSLRTMDEDFASLVNAGTASLERIQAALPADGLLLEYYVARDRIFACVVSPRSLRIQMLGPAGDARRVFRLLQFQLSKFRLGADYLARFSSALRSAVQAHLSELYRQLIAPVRSLLQAAHLTIVPHGFLHYLPFQSLMQEGRCLVDDFTVSYAPSASVFALFATRPPTENRESLVMGIPDLLAPQIRAEAKTVAGILPEARLFVGDGATHELLLEFGPQSRYVHIATHGLFRQDNPMFSSIRLGRSELNLYDLYRMRLSAELVTLSGCGTGLNAVVGGDELLGLVRGLLYAGAQAVLVSLWDVNDDSTAKFMKFFYEGLQRQANKAAALQNAMQRLREDYPHPYYWAPFVLIGKFD